MTTNNDISDRLHALNSFIKNESFGGILLFLSAIFAVTIANSSFSGMYYDLWNMPLGISIGDNIISMSLRMWINDALMTFFFLVVGLEIKREMVIGELSSLEKALFPIIAAIGGMIAPASIYLFFNPDNPSGFGIPMATDIAFALGILMLLGRRVSPILKLILIAIAIADDLGAILIVALVYTNDLHIFYLAHIAIIYGIIWFLNYKNVHILWPYLVLGLFLWIYIHNLGVHATLTGVLLAFAIPIKSKMNEKKFIYDTKQLIEDFEAHIDKEPILNNYQIEDLEDLEEHYGQVQNPLVKIEHNFSGFSTYIIMPLFALANAGIIINFANVSEHILIFTGVLLGLLVGKPLGIFLLSYLAVKLNIAKKPSDLPWSEMLAIGFLGGIGFTMSIFISNLAFVDTNIIDAVKLAIFIASILAAIIGVVLIVFISHKKHNVFSRRKMKQMKQM